MNPADVIQTATVESTLFWSASESTTFYAVPVAVEGWKVEECGQYRKLRLCPPPGSENHAVVGIEVIHQGERTGRKVHTLDVLESVEAVHEKMQQVEEPTVWWAGPWKNSPLKDLWRERLLLAGNDGDARWLVQVWVKPKEWEGREDKLEQNVQQVLKGLNFSAVTLGCEEKIPGFKGVIRITEDD